MFNFLGLTTRLVSEIPIGSEIWPAEFVLVVLGALGLLLGSFANVVILRLPNGESIATPRSRCPQCLTPISWFDNIPVLSYIFLFGKCRSCRARISPRYPLVELLMAILFVGLALSVGWKWTLLEYLIMTFGLVVVSFIDLDHFLIPDVFSLSGIAIGLIGALVNPERSFTSAVSGVMMGGGFLWAVAYIYLVLRKQEGMGGGDIKLLGWIGAVAGWQAIPFVILSSSILGSVVGLFAMRKSQSGLKTVLPFGPFLALGTVIYLLGGYKFAYDYLVVFFPWLEPFDI